MVAGRNQGATARRLVGEADDASAPRAVARGDAPLPASRHYRRARRDRGADTRARLIVAALDVFGRLGFEGASTRQIAREAGANLAAIVYHFGSKEALHLAVAEHVTAQIALLAGPTLAEVGAAAVPSPEAARALLCRLIETQIDIMLGNEEAELWARFIMREQMEPTAAFEVIYAFIGNAQSLCTRLFATALGRAEEDEEVRLRMFTLFGQVLIFRIAQQLVFRRMGWSAIGARERSEIKRIITGQLAAILDEETRR